MTHTKEANVEQLNLEQLIGRTEHSTFLTTEEYVHWRGYLSSIAGFLEKQAKQDISSLIGEILADCVDLATLEHRQKRERAIFALNESIPGARDHILAPDPVRLVGHVFEMVMNFRGRHKTIWAMSHTPVYRLTGVDINTVQFYPLPHGLIVCRRYAGNHQLRNIAAIGNCLIRDAGMDIVPNSGLSMVATRITIEHALMSLLESWRLGHGRARRYLCDTTKGYLAHTKTQAGKIPE